MEVCDGHGWHSAGGLNIVTQLEANQIAAYRAGTPERDFDNASFTSTCDC